VPPGVAPWLASAGLIDAILGMMLIEAATLGLLHRMTGRGVPVRQLAPTMLAGALLLLALRSTLDGHAAQLPVWLGAAFLAHLADIAVRWDR
jgi:hypothetical protein